MGAALLSGFNLWFAGEEETQQRDPQVDLVQHNRNPNHKDQPGKEAHRIRGNVWGDKRLKNSVNG